MRAIWTIIWHTGRYCTINIAGTHVNHDEVYVGGHKFEGDWYRDIAPRLIAWAELLRHREANAPLPEPPS